MGGGESMCHFVYACGGNREEVMGANKKTRDSSSLNPWELYIATTTFNEEGPLKTFAVLALVMEHSCKQQIFPAFDPGLFLPSQGNPFRWRIWGGTKVSPIPNASLTLLLYAKRNRKLLTSSAFCVRGISFSSVWLSSLQPFVFSPANAANCNGQSERQVSSSKLLFAFIEKPDKEFCC